MRNLPSFRLLFLLSALLVPAAAHADTFTFVPSNGNPTITFSIPDPTTPYTYVSGSEAFYDLTATNGDILIIYFENDAVAYETVYQDAGFGHFDFQLGDTNSNLQYFVDGPQLYSGDESSPVFLIDTYNLTADPKDTSQGFLDTGGTLTITTADEPSSSPVPEPSSFALLGTGVLAIFGAVKRRFGNV